MTPRGVRASRWSRSAAVRAPGAGLAVLATLSLAACSSGSTSLATLPGTSTAATPSGSAGPPSVNSSVSTPSTSSSTSSSTTTAGTLEGADLVTVGVAKPPDPAQAEVFTAYVEFWQADMAALSRSDPTWQPLLDRVSGRQRTSTLALLTANRDKGQRVTGTITIRPQVLAVRGTVATVRDCADLSRTQVVDSSGQIVPGSKGKAGVEYSVTMTRQQSTWTVDNVDRVDGPGCTG